MNDSTSSFWNKGNTPCVGGSGKGVGGVPRKNAMRDGDVLRGCFAGQRPIRANEIPKQNFSNEFVGILRPERASRFSAGQRPIRANEIPKQDFSNEFVGILRPERAARFSAGQRPALCPAQKMSPVRAARILRTPLQMMRAALTGLKYLSPANVGLRPTLNRAALSGRKKQSSRRDEMSVENEHVMVVRPVGTGCERDQPSWRKWTHRSGWCAHPVPTGRREPCNVFSTNISSLRDDVKQMIFFVFQFHLDKSKFGLMRMGFRPTPKRDALSMLFYFFVQPPIQGVHP